MIYALIDWNKPTGSVEYGDELGDDDFISVSENQGNAYVEESDFVNDFNDGFFKRKDYDYELRIIDDE